MSSFAAYVMGEAPSVSNHAARYKWAQSAAMNSAGITAALANTVVLDSNVKPGLMASSDAQIQAGTEAQIDLLSL